MRPLAFVVSLAISLSALAQNAFDAKAVDRVMLATMRAWQIPGAAIAIVRNDRVVYVGAYGVKDLVTNEPVTPDTLFQIGSTSKAFTSTGLAMLVDEKRVAWDDPVRKHVEYFRLADRCADEHVSVRDLLSHRTGLPRRDELWDNTPLTREEVVRSIGGVALSMPFRGAYQYQNIMFIAAGEVIEQASGTSWDDFTRARLFQPLRMTRTLISDADWSANDHATGYRYDWKKDRIVPQRPIDTANVGAAGAIKSTARDMANWIRFHLADGVFDGVRLVSAESLAETKAPHTPVRLENSTHDSHPESNVMSYALGWNVQDYRGELLVSHSGALNGFRAHVDLLPRRAAGFVLLSNVGRGTALVALRNTLADMLSGKPSRDWNAYYLMVERKVNEKDAKEKEERLAKRKANTQPSRPLAAYAGTYESAPYGKATVTLVNDALVLQWNRLTIPLAHFHYDVFTAESEADDVDEQVAFDLSPDGEVTTMTLYGEAFARSARPASR